MHKRNICNGEMKGWKEKKRKKKQINICEKRSFDKTLLVIINHKCDIYDQIITTKIRGEKHMEQINKIEKENFPTEISS